jgi:uncharacterized membrane protein
VAGVFFGLGIATKLYPVLLLVVLLFLCWRSGRLAAWVACAAAAVGSFVVAYLPAILLSRNFAFPDSACPHQRPLAGWKWFWELNSTRGADWDSLWFQLQHLTGKPLDSTSCGQSPTWLNLGVALATLAVVGVVALLVLLAPRRPRVPQAAFLLVAGFLLVNKVDSPQYVLWLIPLAVLARPRWPAFLAWQATEALVLVTRFYFFVGNDYQNAHGHPGEGLPIGGFFAAVGLRDIALLVLMGMVVREMWRPDLDVVRADDADDPAGGPLDGAADRWGRLHEPVGRPATA